MRSRARTRLGSCPSVNVARLENLSVTEQSTLLQLQELVEVSLHLRAHGLVNATLYTIIYEDRPGVLTCPMRRNLTIAQHRTQSQTDLSRWW